MNSYLVVALVLVALWGVWLWRNSQFALHRHAKKTIRWYRLVPTGRHATPHEELSLIHI